MSRGVLAVLDSRFEDIEAEFGFGTAEDLREARSRIAEVFAAAHASLAARDLADQMAADDRLRAALAACEPETPHEPV